MLLDTLNSGKNLLSQKVWAFVLKYDRISQCLHMKQNAWYQWLTQFQFSGRRLSYHIDRLDRAFYLLSQRKAVWSRLVHCLVYFTLADFLSCQGPMKLGLLICYGLVTGDQVYMICESIATLFKLSSLNFIVISIFIFIWLMCVILRSRHLC